MSSKSIAKRRNPILSKLSAQQSLLTSYPHSAPISLQSGGDGSGFSNQKSWSKELIAAATTLQSIAMSSTRVRTENPYDNNTIHNTELSNFSFVGYTALHNHFVLQKFHSFKACNTVVCCKAVMHDLFFKR